MGITLYDLTAGMLKIQAIIEDGDDPELWKDQLKDIDEQFETKVVNIGRLCRNITAEAQVYIDEGKKLADRAKAMQNKAERLRAYAEDSMKLAGVTEIKDGTLVAKFQKLPDKVAEEIDIDMLADDFRRVIPEKVEPDKKAILDAFKQGVAVNGATVETGRTALKFK